MTAVPYPRRGNLSGPLLGLICGLLVLAGLLFWVFRQDNSGQQPPNPGNQPTAKKDHHERFLGSKSCAECHADIYQSYQHHPMANSISRPVKATMIEDYQQHTSFISGGRRYRVALPDNENSTQTDTGSQDQQFPRHHEKMVAEDGQDIYDQSVPISFVIGSGSRGRSYLTQDQERLYQSPITWYVQDQTWDLSPGYVPTGHQRFERLVTESCLSCHVGRINFVGEQTNRYDPVQPFQEPSIGCERCHGPGGQHVDAHRQGKVKDDQYIVNPEKLAPRERNSVCYQCHLSGKHRVLRYGKRARDFRPGQPLRDTWTVFVSGTGVDKQQQARLTSNVEQMHASRCFQESNGKMGCTSCHDAHYQPKPEARASFYRARCLQCHQEQGCSLPAAEQAAAPALNSCTFCHMKKLTTSDIAHSAQADHRILRFPASSPKPKEDSKPGMTSKERVSWNLFDGAVDTLPAWDKERAVAIGRFHEAVKNKDTQAIQRSRDKLIKVVKQVPNDYEARLELAQTFYRLEQYEKALEHVEIVLEAKPNYEEALALAGFAAQFTNQFQDSIDYFSRKLTLNPRDANLYIILAEMVGQQQDLRSAIKILKQGLEIDPSSIILHSLIADWYRRIGQTEESQRHLDLIESIRHSMQRDEAASQSEPK